MFTRRASPRRCVLVSSETNFRFERLTLDSAFGLSSCAADMTNVMYGIIKQWDEEKSREQVGQDAVFALPSCCKSHLFWRRIVSPVKLELFPASTFKPRKVTSVRLAQQVLRSQPLSLFPREIELGEVQNVG